MTYDTNNVTITVQTSSRNGLQNESEIYAFTKAVLRMAHDMLTNSVVDVHSEMHRKTSVSTEGPKNV